MSYKIAKSKGLAHADIKYKRKVLTNKDRARQTIRDILWIPDNRIKKPRKQKERLHNDNNSLIQERREKKNKKKKKKKVAPDLWVTEWVSKGQT